MTNNESPKRKTYPADELWNRDTDADGRPDKIDAQYTHPSAEEAQKRHEEQRQRDNQAQTQNYIRRRR